MKWLLLHWQALLLLAVAMTVVTGFGHWRYRAGYDDAAHIWQKKWAERDASEAILLAKRQAESRDEEQRRQVEIGTIRDDARRQIEGARADAEHARNVSRGLHVAANNLASRLAERETCGDTAASGRGEAATGGTLLLADLFRRADERAGAMAAEADRARLRGNTCERAYDALTQHVAGN